MTHIHQSQDQSGFSYKLSLPSSHILFYRNDFNLSELTKKQHKIMDLYIDLWNDNQYICMTNQKMAELAGCTIRTVRSANAVLEKKGFINRSKPHIRSRNIISLIKIDLSLGEHQEFPKSVFLGSKETFLTENFLLIRKGIKRHHFQSNFFLLNDESPRPRDQDYWNEVQDTLSRDAENLKTELNIKKQVCTQEVDDLFGAPIKKPTNTMRQKEDVMADKLLSMQCSELVLYAKLLNELPNDNELYESMCDDYH